MSKSHIAVIGAGAFGGWTALYLRRHGARVTLLDAWGPGNGRASSGGETRVIRGTYGPGQPYTKMAAEATKLWQEHQEQWKRQLFHRTGVLWLAGERDDQFERGSLPLLREFEIPFEELPAAEIARRWPQFNLDGIGWGIYEPHSGFLSARLACQTVLEQFIADGGDYQQQFVRPDNLESGRVTQLMLAGGATVFADQYVFACGPWLSGLFPQAIRNNLRVTKQDVFFFGTPPGDEFSANKLPVWGDRRGQFMYGIPDHDGRGFKVGDDSRGPEFDPTLGERCASSESLKSVREYLAFRFPKMKDAPLIETRVCQYENTPDNHFIIDRHPGDEKLWIVGGGSGHGFKHGPVVGKMVAKLVLEGGNSEPDFRLGRFT